MNDGQTRRLVLGAMAASAGVITMVAANNGPFHGMIAPIAP